MSLLSLYDEKWYEYLDKLKQFKKDHGHCRVPYKNSQIGQGILAKERYCQLQGLGFTWNQQRRDSKSSSTCRRCKRKLDTDANDEASDSDIEEEDLDQEALGLGNGNPCKEESSDDETVSCPPKTNTEDSDIVAEEEDSDDEASSAGVASRMTNNNDQLWKLHKLVAAQQTIIRHQLDQLQDQKTTIRSQRRTIKRLKIKKHDLPKQIISTLRK
ncbi:expressed unknown protein [Seminavis robusta]|uniref:Helicase-associated domain-containing protein n=1 Tax=Seminavis robusta TaxID=568900 RepID=A0A9N8EP23_9STRA|nr:expressed unknown protein [Seminavis robusta]|eukprot:Sro1464_g274920.1 n/a (214) ;mRNA; r:23418-24288